MSRNITLYIKDILQNMREAVEFIHVLGIRVRLANLHISFEEPFETCLPCTGRQAAGRLDGL